MRTFASALIVGSATAGNIFETLHSIVDDTEHLLEEAQPLLDELQGDISDFSGTVHNKANRYMSLFDELKTSIGEE